MITEDKIRKWIILKGHKPACPSIDLRDIELEYKNGKRFFEFFVNKHNLCWYASESWRVVNSKLILKYKLTIQEFDMDIRDDILNKILS